ncbi:hypothetical protein [Bosea sp. ANAM02]|uniref:hypothetical protein n=1 Tax=Bosea sp. ANAM02 TaxID=2020412 RepID=UPI00140ED224|nr:hypothetical protein [Bosea sp. ANAM02]BCB17336.1 hypothetical protein OCUBac02_02300 [Bosea sp. ANAM02]
MKANVISRRACLAVAASAAVAPAVSATPEYSRMDELIADWHLAREQAEALSSEADRIHDTADLPKVEVYDGEQCFRYPHEVSTKFDRWIEAWESDRLQAEFAPRLRERRESLLAELRRLEAARTEAERLCGLKTAEDLWQRAEQHQWDIRGEIFARQPTTMAEVAAKNAFILRQIQMGLPPTDDELTIIFATPTVA